MPVADHAIVQRAVSSGDRTRSSAVAKTTPRFREIIRQGRVPQDIILIFNTRLHGVRETRSPDEPNNNRL